MTFEYVNFSQLEVAQITLHHIFGKIELCIAILSILFMGFDKKDVEFFKEGHE